MVVISGCARDNGDCSVLVADDIVLGAFSAREVVTAILFSYATWVILLAGLARAVETLIFNVLARSFWFIASLALYFCEQLTAGGPVAEQSGVFALLQMRNSEPLL